MGIQRILKLPFRLGRSIWRTARSVAPTPRAAESSVEPDEASTTSAPEPPPRPPVGVRVEDTPNPEARKFVCDITLVAEGSFVANEPGTGAPPWLESLIALEGVRTVFATRDFVTITRAPDGPGWDALSRTVITTLQDHLPR